MTRGYYSLIQFCPDLARLEAANVGVLLYCPEQRACRTRFSRNIKHVQQFFGKKRIGAGALARLRDNFRARLGAASPGFTDVEGLRDFIAAEANEILITDPRPIAVTTPHATLTELFDRLVERPRAKKQPNLKGTRRSIMTFDPKTMVHTRSAWFQPRVKYEGMARAEFSNPPGVIEGPATVDFDRAGACRVRITVERITAHDQQHFSLRTATTLGNYFIDGEANPCTSLTVQTEAGTFTGGDRIIHHGFPPDAENRVELRPLRPRFEVNGAARAKYWVLPLSNFMPEAWRGEVHPQLNDHPLRLRNSSPIPKGWPDDEKRQAEWYVRQHTNLLTFMLNGEAGFIERMSQYAKLVKWVRRNQSYRVTALMVGPAHVQTVDWSDQEGLFPLDILSILTLATGTPVGAPWIEFRDENGALVRRVHICFGAGRYKREHAAIPDKFLGNGCGYLVGQMLTASDRGKKYLRAAINHAFSATQGTIEGNVISFCRGFETLCRYHGFINQHLSARLEQTQQTTLKTILQEAAKKIQTMRKAESDPARKAVLEKIESKTVNAGQTEKSFGLAVADLAKKFGFFDEQVLDAYLATHPHPTRHTTWPGLINHYRAAATHDAYFELRSREELYDALRVRNHLHDLLLRVLLKTISYAGEYQSPIPPVTMRMSVDWVTPTTPAGLLGYA